MGLASQVWQKESALGDTKKDLFKKKLVNHKKWKIKFTKI